MNCLAFRHRAVFILGRIRGNDRFSNGYGGDIVQVGGKFALTGDFRQYTVIREISRIDISSDDKNNFIVYNSRGYDWLFPGKRIIGTA